MKKNKKTFLIFLSLFFFLQSASFVFAQVRAEQLVENFTKLLLSTVPIIATLSIVVFFWGIVKVIYNAENQKEHTEARKFMVYGLIGVFVIFSIWGIILFLEGVLGVPSTEECQGPSLSTFFTSCVVPIGL
jgi:heme/copper-type cytochrome/quinol oxidase subunit 2